MKKSTKAAILSATLFPGAGHIYLKRYTSGILLAAISLTGIIYLIWFTVEKSLQIVEKIQSGYIQPDVMAIAEMLTRQTSGSQTGLLNIATTAVILCWLIGIIDSLRLGFKGEKS